MPYKRIGRRIYHKKGGKWTLKQECKNAANAKAAMGLLYGLEEGTIKKPKKKRK